MSRTDFRITQLETCIVDHALRPDRIVVSPAGRHDQSRFVSLMVQDEDGVRGYGEAATTTQWSGETAETAQWVMENLLKPLLLGRTFGHPREALEIMDVALYNNFFAKSAIDTALWDLWARRQNCPVTSLIADRPLVTEIPTRASVGAYGVEETVRIAEAFWREGIEILKFKIGLPGLDDAARLRAVRERLGDAPVFTADANGAYGSADEAVAAAERLLPFNVALLEQPTPRDRISLLAQVRRRLPIPIMADECVFTPGHLQEALELDAFDILSVYPGKNGGFTQSLSMAQAVGRAGKKCAIGSNLETDLGQAAMAALAGSLSVFPVGEIPCDLPAAIFYEESPLLEPLPLRHGKFVLPTGPGFGVLPRCFAGID